MLSPTSSSTILAAILIMMTSTSATPLEPTYPLRARAVQTVYKYMSATTAPLATVTPIAKVTCPDSIVTNKGDCPSACTAAAIPVMLGIATDSWSCVVPPAETLWTSVEATSTCAPGSAVTTYTLYGGQYQMGCKATTT
ncbi:hypothetical protein DOTSEDRAFT_73723 [Dothistroma septosporum NZE10]|uniref:Ig-like domain-containing protein n=1 Tax=Dothistroma septosporum (strain NZE10 / CBS 128990) TaxID=675120 RepID=N1PGY4_DOTSN|nr:hypothetical protein DOTSEDRAFT_73723 [Dothistroma septosporum NZE10]